MVRLPPRLRPLFPYLKPAYSHATEALAPLTQRWSRRRGGWLPHGVAPTLHAAAHDGGGRSVVARPAEVIERGEQLGWPPSLSPVAEGAFAHDGNDVPEVTVAELPGGRVLGPHRAIVSGAGLLVDEVSRYFGNTRPRQHPLFLTPSVGAPYEVEGTLGVLASRADSNYYHFLFDALPRLAVLEQARVRAPDLADPDRWYVPQATTFQREAVELVGLTPDRIVDAARYPHVRAATLVVPGPPAMVEKNPPWVVAFLRERLLASVPHEPGTRRIYVTRGHSVNNRSVGNEPAVVAALRARGFEAIDPGALPLVAQIEAFASAEFIVAPHGAALANLAFASPGAAVVELFPAGYLLPDFWRLAGGVPGLRYRYLAGPASVRRPTRAAAIVKDITVDVDRLERMLDELS